MATLRYAAQEAANIAKAAEGTKQAVALDGYRRKVAADAGYQPTDADLTAIAALSPSNDDFIQRKAGAWTNRTVAQVKTDLGLTNPLNWVSVPASAAASGTAGQVAYESGFFYICVSANTWQRVAIATW